MKKNLVLVSTPVIPESKFIKHKENKQRFSKYKISKSLPTVMEVLTMLENASVTRKGAEIVTKFTGYERIGVKIEDDFNMFEINTGEQASSFHLVTNDKEANVSIRSAIKGYVRINPKTAAKVGLDTKIESIQYKSHTIIKNGELHTAEIVVNVDEETFKELKKLNVPIKQIASSKTAKSGFTQVVIDFTGLKIAKSSLSDEEVIKLLSEINVLKVEEKAIKAHQEKNNQETSNQAIDTPDTKYTKEQLEVLAEYGIKDGVYSYIAPKADTTPALRKTREIQYQLKGESSIPSIKEVIKKQPKKGIGKELLDKYMEYNGTDGEVLEAMAKEVKAKIQARKVALQNAKLDYLNRKGESATIEGASKTLIIKVKEVEKQYSIN